LKINKQPFALTTDDESEIITKLSFKEYKEELNKISFPHYKYVAHVFNFAAKYALDIDDSSVKKLTK
ncbi:18132_t:CDS:1, partial [Racocetra persica]